MRQTESDALAALKTASDIVEAERSGREWATPSRTDIRRMAAELTIAAESLVRVQSERDQAENNIAEWLLEQAGYLHRRIDKSCRRVLMVLAGDVRASRWRRGPDDRPAAGRKGTLTAVVDAAIDLAYTGHTRDANCAAGDCGSCTRKPAEIALDRAVQDYLEGDAERRRG